jgi:hypothetical protein
MSETAIVEMQKIRNAPVPRDFNRTTSPTVRLDASSRLYSRPTVHDPIGMPLDAALRASVVGYFDSFRVRITTQINKA